MLRPRFAWLVLVLLAVGCDRAADYLDVFQEQRSALDAAADVLERVRGEKDLADALPAMDDRLTQLEKLARRVRTMPQPPREALERLEAERPVMERSAARFQGEVRRVRALPGGEEFFKQLEANHQGLTRTTP